MLEFTGGGGVTPARLLFATGGGRGVTLFTLFLSGAEERNQFSGFSLETTPVFPVAGSGGVSATGVPAIAGCGWPFTIGAKVVPRGGLELARTTACVRGNPVVRTALPATGVLFSAVTAAA